MNREITIARVGIRIFQGEVANPIRLAFGDLIRRSLAIVEVESEDGAVGYGESWVNHPAWAVQERAVLVREGIAGALIGLRFWEPSEVQEFLLRRFSGVARQGGIMAPLIQAISGVDIAIWDLYCRLQDRSLRSVLAQDALRNEVPLYASGLGPSPMLEEEILAAVEHGHRHFKVKLGFDATLDRDVLRRVRAVIGDDAVLAVDANQGWSLSQALGMSDALMTASVAWLEEPIIDNPAASNAALHAALGIPIALGENEYGVERFRDLLHQPYIKYVQPDVSKTGGITSMLEVCRLAVGAAAAVAPHHFGGGIGLAATLQIASACPEVEVVEFDVRENPLGLAAIDPPIAVSKGYASVADRPGIGVVPSYERLAPYELPA